MKTKFRRLGLLALIATLIASPLLVHHLSKQPAISRESRLPTDPLVVRADVWSRLETISSR